MAVAVTAEIAKKAAHLAWNDFPEDLVERVGALRAALG